MNFSPLQPLKSCSLRMVTSQMQSEYARGVIPGLLHPIGSFTVRLGNRTLICCVSSQHRRRGKVISNGSANETMAAGEGPHRAENEISRLLEPTHPEPTCTVWFSD